MPPSSLLEDMFECGDSTHDIANTPSTDRDPPSTEVRSLRTSPRTTGTGAGTETWTGSNLAMIACAEVRKWSCGAMSAWAGVSIRTCGVMTAPLSNMGFQKDLDSSSSRSFAWWSTLSHHVVQSVALDNFSGPRSSRKSLKFLAPSPKGGTSSTIRWK